MIATVPQYDFAALKARTQEIAEKTLGKPDRTAHADGGLVLIYHCPFHAERTPSFWAYEDHYHCFGACGFHGDVVDFVAALHHLSTGEAARKLGAGIANAASLEAYRAQRDAERQRRQEEQAAKRAQARAARVWEPYHDNMGEAGRWAWRRAGVPDKWQDYWRFGYTETRTYEWNDQFFQAPALTIPCLSWANGAPPQFQTLQYRLIDAPKEHGKYRVEKDLGTAAWIAKPDLHPGDWGRCLVVEGSKKGAVTFIQVRPFQIQVAAIPAQRDWAGIVEQLQAFGEVIVWLDPGIEARPKNAGKGWEPADVALCRAIGPQARYVRYPTKIDDAINDDGLTGRQIVDIARYARRVKA